MAIETRAFPLGAVQEFQLTLGDESAVVLRGKVVARRTSRPPGRRRRL